MEQERQKHFLEPPQQIHKKCFKDFDLTAFPEEMDRYSFAKNYLVPMMPEEFKFFQEELEIFEQKQREWRKILRSKEDLKNVKSSMEYEKLKKSCWEVWEKFDVEKVTAEEFENFFDAALFTPRLLFPTKHRKMIETIEVCSYSEEIRKAREEFRTKQEHPNDITDVGGLRPMKNEPIALTELLLQIQKVKESLQPFMWKVELPKTFFAEPLKKQKKQKNRQRKTQFISKSSSQSSDRSKRASTLSKLSYSSSRASSKSFSSISTAESDIPEDEMEVALGLIPHAKGKWSTRDIYETQYDPSNKVLTFYAGCLGSFGLATRKYCNLPLKNWQIFPSIENGQKFVILNVATAYNDLEFKVTDQGITVGTQTRKGLKMFTEKPLSFYDLKILMISLNINIFPEADASWYVPGISEKHLPMEVHTYKSMATYCFFFHFKSHDSNRVMPARTALLQSRVTKEVEKDFKVLKVTPLDVATVVVIQDETNTDTTKVDCVLEPEDQDVSFQKIKKNISETK